MVMPIPFSASSKTYIFESGIVLTVRKSCKHRAYDYKVKSDKYLFKYFIFFFFEFSILMRYNIRQNDCIFQWFPIVYELITQYNTTHLNSKKNIKFHKMLNGFYARMLCAISIYNSINGNHTANNNK